MTMRLLQNARFVFDPTTFERNYRRHLQLLKLKGLRPKTIDAYADAIRCAGERFDKDIDQLTEQPLTDHSPRCSTPTRGVRLTSTSTD